MASRTVNLSEEAYRRLANLKREGESFSDVVNRLTGKYAVRALVGTLTPRQATALRRAVRDTDRRASRDMERSARRMRRR